MAENKILSLEEYLREVAGEAHANLARAEGVRANEEAFGSMKAHILSLYEGVQSSHAFEDDNGSVFDCIPIRQQPSLRGKEPAKPTSLPPMQGLASAAHAEAVGERRESKVEPQLGSGGKDRHGRNRHCPEGHIPMRRVQLEEMMRFQDLRHFLRKSPMGGQFPPQEEKPRAHAPGEVAAATAASHKYAHAYQNVNNLGGHSFLNIWKPSIGANQIFSLSQHWYAGGSGTGLQTAEVGWQVYPGKYGNSNPCLFIYWTADDYHTTGCYNLDCTAFVQTNHSWTLGGALSPVSVYGGSQYSLEVAYYLYQGNWWLYLQGTDAAHTVGYYPTSIYRGGALATKATEIDYGGETVGTSSFPPMGSGHFASEEWQKACYQRDIVYYPSGGGASPANLTTSQPSPGCYTIAKKSYAAPWNQTIYFGGPGGSSC